MPRSDSIVSARKHDGRGKNKQHGFAYHEIQGSRPSQEDALAWAVFEPSVFNELTAEQIGQRLWSTYRNLNDKFKQYSNKKKLKKEPGTTASTTLIRGHELITATLADTEAFVVIYDEEDNPVAVHRLNRRNHCLQDPDEHKRVVDLGGHPYEERIYRLAVSRAFGDFNHSAKAINKVMGYRQFTADPVIADADINITDISKIPIRYKVQVITACDGFTERVEPSSKEEHELWLLKCLQGLSASNPSESDIAAHLVSEAYKSGSTDNISVSVQTVKQANKTPSFYGMTGIYDGHGGKRAAHFIAYNMKKMIEFYLMLDEKAYKRDRYSVEKFKEDFNRDNSLLKSFDLNTLLTPDLSSPAAQVERLRLKIKAKLKTPTDFPSLKAFKAQLEKYKFDTPEKINAFKNDVIKTIQLNAAYYEDKNDDFRLLAYLALLVSVVGIVTIILDQVSRHSKTTGNRYLFLRPESAKVLDEIEEAVKKLDERDSDNILHK